MRWYRYFEVLAKDKDWSAMHNEYDGSWRPGKAKTCGTNSPGIGPVLDSSKNTNNVCQVARSIV